MPLIAWLCILLPVTGWLFGAQATQGVDSSNRALKAPDSADARNLARLAGLGITEDVLLLGFRVMGGLPMLPVDRREVEACRDRIAALPGVASCDSLPETEPSLALLRVTMAAGDVDATADRVVELADRDCPTSMRPLATGIPLHEARIAEYVAGERRTIVPIIGLCLFAAAWALYRRIGLAIAALAPALLAIVWTSGIVALLGHELDPVSSLLDPVLLTIGVATSVHFVEGWRRCCAEVEDPTEAGAITDRRLRTPTTLATVTTMIGLLSMTTSSVPAVVDFGIRASLGIALLHTFVFLLLPRLLAVLRPTARERSKASPRDAGHWVEALLKRTGRLTTATVAVTVLAAAGLPRLVADNDPLTMLPATEQVRLDHQELTTRLGGVEMVYLYAPPGSNGTAAEHMLPFVASAQTEPGIAGPGGAPLRGPDGDVAVPLLLAPGGSAARHDLFDALEQAARVSGLDGVVPAGAAVQIARDSDHLIRGLLVGTTAVFVLLGAGMCLGLRSLRLGLVGSIPMVLACVWIYGGIGWLDHPVSVATGMIGCTMLGLIVDNVLHFLHHFRRYRITASSRRAVELTLQQTGRPVWVSSALLILGFATAATSSLSTTIEFALLACSTIAVALFGCIVVVPMVLARTPDEPEATRAL